MLYYKVVHSYARRTGFHSAVAFGRWRLGYVVGEWTRPKAAGSKLFVFESEPAARAFAVREGRPAIFTCEVEGVPIRPINMGWLNELGRFWRAYCYGRDYIGDRVPQGTLWVDAVKLIALVE